MIVCEHCLWDDEDMPGGWQHKACPCCGHRVHSAPKQPAAEAQFPWQAEVDALKARVEALEAQAERVRRLALGGER